MAVAAEFFTTMNIGQMDLNDGESACSKCVSYGNACMGVGGRVNDNPLASFNESLLDPVYKCPLVIGLEGDHLASELQGKTGKRFINLYQGSGAVKLGLPSAEEIEIWSMYHQYFHG
jgi:hypothetical protein